MECVLSLLDMVEKKKEDEQLENVVINLVALTFAIESGCIFAYGSDIGVTFPLYIHGPAPA